MRRQNCNLLIQCKPRKVFLGGFVSTFCCDYNIKVNDYYDKKYCSSFKTRWCGELNLTGVTDTVKTNWLDGGQTRQSLLQFDFNFPSDDSRKNRCVVW